MNTSEKDVAADMKAEMSVVEPAPFGPLNEGLAALSKAAGLPAGDGLRSLNEWAWLSVEEHKRAALRFEPCADGFRLVLERVGAARWVALGVAIPLSALRLGRFVAVRVVCSSQSSFSFIPCLRLIDKDIETTDSFAPDYSFATGPRRELLNYMQIDKAGLEGAETAELLIYMQGNDFEVDIHTLEILLML